jgi:hypothetical protein
MRPRSSAQPPERRPQWTRSRDLDHPPTMIHGGHQGFETDIDPDRRPRPGMPIGEVTVDFHGEGHEPALGAPGDGGGEDPGPSLRQLASQGLGGLVGAEGAQPGEGDRGPRAAHHPGAEAEGVPAPALLLALGEAQTGPFRSPLLEAMKSRRARSRLRKASCTLRVLLPPGQLGVLPLRLIPDPMKVDGRVPLLLGRVPLPALIQSPVPGESRRSRMGAEPLLLGGSGIEREPVSQGHPTKPASWGPGLVDLHPSLPVRVAMALAAR